MTLSNTDFYRIRQKLYDHCGINLTPQKKSLVKSRLARLVRNSPFDSFTQYVDFVLSVQGEQDFHILVDAISTNVTSFFREKEHFDYLTQSQLPRLLKRAKDTGIRKIRAFSAGCSSGQEPYSIAMSLWDGLNSPQSWDLKILATDISAQMLQVASLGAYDQMKTKPLTLSQRSRHFVYARQQGDKMFQAKDSLKKLITFRYLNLLNDWPFKGSFDLIFCRNVMIYFDKQTQMRLVSRFWDHLTPHGILYIGHSESLTGIKQKFRYLMPAIYAKS